MVFTRVWRAVKHAIGFKSNNPYIQSVLSLDAVWSGVGYASAAAEGYAKNVVVYKCVHTVAQSVGSLEWYVSDASDKALANHEFLKRLAKPNPVDNTQSLLYKYIASKWLGGEAFIELVFGIRNQPAEMWIVRPDQVNHTAGSKRMPTAYSINCEGGTKIFEVDQTTGEAWTRDKKSKLIHIKSFHPSDDFRGMSPLTAAARSVDLHNSIAEWNKKLLDNGAKPSGAFTYKDELTQEQADQMAKEIDTKWTGTTNAAKPLILANGLDYKILSLSPVDMDYLNSKHSSARDIAIALGLPPLLLNIPGDSTYSNYKEARIAFYEETVLPAANELAYVLTTQVLPLYGQPVKMCYDEDKISALEPKRREKWDKFSAADFLTINEKREALGYKRVDGGDELYVDAGKLPLSMEADTTEDEVVDTEVE